jgi:hypothetical protein
MALEKLREFVDTHGMKEKVGPQAFADFERELHRRFLEAERDVIADEMARFDCRRAPGSAGIWAARYGV